jgi:hypothetical protein
VSIGQDSYPISTICDLVNNEYFAPKEMPDRVRDAVLRLRKVDPTTILLDRSFQSGALYVAEIIRGRRRASEYKQQLTDGSKSDGSLLLLTPWCQCKIGHQGRPLRAAAAVKIIRPPAQEPPWLSEC